MSYDRIADGSPSTTNYGGIGNRGESPPLNPNLRPSSSPPYAPPRSDKVAKIQGELNVVTEKMVKNIDVVIQRGEDISKLEGKSKELEEHAVTFRNRAGDLKRHFCKKNARAICLIVALVIAIIIILSVIGCSISRQCS